MYGKVREGLRAELDAIVEAGLYKSERIIDSAQSAEIEVNQKSVLNFCANNYLGLANDAVLKDAAKAAIDRFGFGLSSVRFICGTQSLHKDLEARVSRFFDMEDAILYAACFDANGGLFEPLLSDQDAILSDALNHASIIDGIRLCKAQRYRYPHSDMSALEEQLKEARDKGARRMMIATDGVFSMDGDVANLGEVCDLADKYEALVMVDDCHGTGFFGPTGRGAVEHCGVQGRVDIVTSTLGKALGGASGGFTTGPREVIDLLRQRSRPYLFSNSLPPALVGAGIACFDLLEEGSELRDRLRRNTAHFRKELTALGFEIQPGEHPIVPVMLGDARLAAQIADDLLEEGIYVIGFSYPVVPKGQARIRVQISAAHTEENLTQVLEAFAKVGRRHGVIQGT